MISRRMPTIPKGIISRRGPKPKYPIADLKVGESFLATKDLRNTLAALACYHRKKTGRTFCLVALTADPNTLVFYRKE